MLSTHRKISELRMITNRTPEQQTELEKLEQIIRDFQKAKDESWRWRMAHCDLCKQGAPLHSHQVFSSE